MFVDSVDVRTAFMVAQPGVVVKISAIKSARTDGCGHYGDEHRQRNSTVRKLRPSVLKVHQARQRGIPSASGQRCENSFWRGWRKGGGTTNRDCGSAAEQTRNWRLSSGVWSDNFWQRATEDQDARICRRDLGNGTVGGIAVVDDNQPCRAWSLLSAQGSEGCLGGTVGGGTRQSGVPHAMGLEGEARDGQVSEPELQMLER